MQLNASTTVIVLCYTKDVSLDNSNNNFHISSPPSCALSCNNTFLYCRSLCILKVSEDYVKKSEFLRKHLEKEELEQRNKKKRNILEMSLTIRVRESANGKLRMLQLITFYQQRAEVVRW